MKYHPDRVKCDGPDGGEAAKKKATAKFAEISAAYELLSGGGGGGTASHPSFANSATTAPSNTYPSERYDFPSGMGLFSRGFDPFGFGTFEHFTDPFELFRRTFGDIGAFNDENNIMGAFPPFHEGPSSAGAAMYAPTFGGFTSFGGFPANSTSTSYSSSTFSAGGGAGASSRMVSTTTTVVNGKTVTRREETVVNPDGTRTTTVTSSGDTEEQPKAIQDGGATVSPESPDVAQKVDEDEDEELRQAILLSMEDDNGTEETKQSHTRGYKIETKQHLEQSQVGLHPPAEHPGMPSDETYIVDLTEGDVVDLTNGKGGKPKKKSTAAVSATADYSHMTVKQLKDVLRSKGCKVSGRKAELIERLEDYDAFFMEKQPSEEQIHSKSIASGGPITPPVAPSTAHSTSRKRKFCEVMSRCLQCCFPLPCKRRRLNAIIDDADPEAVEAYV